MLERLTQQLKDEGWFSVEANYAQFKFLRKGQYELAYIKDAEDFVCTTATDLGLNAWELPPAILGLSLWFRLTDGFVFLPERSANSPLPFDCPGGTYQVLDYLSGVFTPLKTSSDDYYWGSIIGYRLTDIGVLVTETLKTTTPPKPKLTAKQLLTKQASEKYFAKKETVPYVPISESEMTDIAKKAIDDYEEKLKRNRGE